MPDQYKEKGSEIIYDQTTISGHRTFSRKAFIRSVVINMCACSSVRPPVWDLFIANSPKNIFLNLVIQSYILPAAVLNVRHNRVKSIAGSAHGHPWFESGKNPAVIR